MPFAINASTRFISPTKTPEYLAAGKPVVSTAIHDVIKAYGDTGLIYIAKNADDFIGCIESALQQDKKVWLKAVDIALANNSWDITCEKIFGDPAPECLLLCNRSIARPCRGQPALVPLAGAAVKRYADAHSRSECWI